MKIDGPYFDGWCSEADRVDALIAALSAFYDPDVGWCNVHINPYDVGGEHRDGISLDEAIAFLRQHADSRFLIDVDVLVRFQTGRVDNHQLALQSHGAEYLVRYAMPPLCAWIGNELFYGHGPTAEFVAVQRFRSVPVVSATMVLFSQPEIEQILLGICAPDATKRVKRGSCSGDYWSRAPLEVCTTYHDEAAFVARDLALTWIHLHDSDEMGAISTLDFDTMAARMEATPKDTRVGVATTFDQMEDHTHHDRVMLDATRDRLPPRMTRIGPRPIAPTDAILTREQVLRAMATPPATLLEALEAASKPDDEWRAVEPIALEAMDAQKQGAETSYVNIDEEHKRFIELHAPYHVRRLDNGGVLLATHPWRTLWQLWADALALLDIRK